MSVQHSLGFHSQKTITKYKNGNFDQRLAKSLVLKSNLSSCAPVPSPIIGLMYSEIGLAVFS